MNDVELAEFRIQRLKDAIDKLEGGNKSAFGRRLGYKDGAFIRQLLAGTRPITEKTIMQIEAIHGMNGWFNLPGEARRPAATPASAVWPFRSISQGQLGGLREEDLRKLEGALGLAMAQLNLGLPVAKTGATPTRLVATSDKNAVNDPEFVQIPLMTVKVRAGIAGFSLDQTGEDTSGAIYLPREWLEKKGLIVERLFATRVGGMSMWPRIDEGDMVLINTADTDRRNGMVYGFNHEGQFVLKRLKRQLNHWYLTSDNPDKAQYPPVMADERTIMIGRAVLLQAEEI